MPISNYYLRSTKPQVSIYRMDNSYETITHLVYTGNVSFTLNNSNQLLFTASNVDFDASTLNMKIL